MFIAIKAGGRGYMALKHELKTKFNNEQKQEGQLTTQEQVELKAADQFMKQLAEKLVEKIKEKDDMGALHVGQITGQRKAHFTSNIFNNVPLAELRKTEGFKALAAACAEPDVDAQLEIVSHGIYSTQKNAVEINIDKEYKDSSHVKAEQAAAASDAARAKGTERHARLLAGMSKG
jgi:hypothetical protein